MFKTTKRRVWRYQRGNQNPYIEEQTTQYTDSDYPFGIFKGSSYIIYFLLSLWGHFVNYCKKCFCYFTMHCLKISKQKLAYMIKILYLHTKYWEHSLRQKYGVILFLHRVNILNFNLQYIILDKPCE